jgi:hypothetical protein
MEQKNEFHGQERKREALNSQSHPRRGFSRKIRGLLARQAEDSVQRLGEGDTIHVPEVRDAFEADEWAKRLEEE